MNFPRAASTEGPQFQYQINGFLVPLDINTNPPFLSMLNALFVDRLDLRVGVLPARYGLRPAASSTCSRRTAVGARRRSSSIYGGQRSTFSPSIEYAACDGAFASYVSGRETWSDTAFSSATPGPTPLHDEGDTAQALGFWTYSPAPGHPNVAAPLGHPQRQRVAECPGAPAGIQTRSAAQATWGSGSARRRVDRRRLRPGSV